MESNRFEQRALGIVKQAFLSSGTGNSMGSGGQAFVIELTAKLSLALDQVYCEALNENKEPPVGSVLINRDDLNYAIDKAEELARELNSFYKGS